MQPYMNYSPILNSQQQRLAQMEQMYQQYNQPPMYQQPMQMQQPPLTGRIIDNESMINASEVPMSGEVALFPMRDGKQIICKSWQADGSIKTVRFVPLVEEPTNSTPTTSESKISLSDEVTDVFMSRFDEIEKRLDKLIPKPTRKTAKEGEE